MSEDAWTLARVADERPELASLARLHIALEDALAAAVEELPPDALRPQFPGPPAVHWFQGKSLLDATGAGRIAPGVGEVVLRLLETLVDCEPTTAEPVAELRRHVAAPDFDWAARLASFRDLPAAAEVPHGALFRFLLLRAVGVPARHLAHSFSAPHAERWPWPRCPYCGIPAAAAVAATGSGRTLLCVLCGGRWHSEGFDCLSCGEKRSDRSLVLGSPEIGPASLEACATCDAALKVLSVAYLPDGPPLALEVLTAGLDALAEAKRGIRRDPVALAAVFPPQ